MRQPYVPTAEWTPARQAAADETPVIGFSRDDATRARLAARKTARDRRAAEAAARAEADWTRWDQFGY
jgi:hypothetical protein